MMTVLAGHYYDLYNLKGANFLRDIVEKHGGAVKLSGLFGVRSILCSDE